MVGLRLVLAALCWIVVYSSILICGLLATGHYLDTILPSGISKQYEGAAWAIVGTYAASIAACLIAPLRLWKIMAGVSLLAAAYWNLPVSFGEAPAVVGFGGSIVSALAAYLTVDLITKRRSAVIGLGSP